MTAQTRGFRELGATAPRLRDREGPPVRQVEGVVVEAESDSVQSLLDDPAVEEIWINGPNQLFAAIEGENRTIATELTGSQIEELVQRFLGHSGRRVDRSSPFVDARLQDGSRLHVAIPPITQQWTVNIRKFVGVRTNDLSELGRSGSLSGAAGDFLASAVKAGLNIVVAGAVGAGKTTLLNCLASAIPPSERVVTCEEVFELQVGIDDVVGMQCREANLEGEGEIPLRRLVKEALRMRPDRIIIGEVRGPEALDMLLAMNAGCAAMTSVHANSARDALRKLTSLPLLAGENVSRDFVEPTVAACIDLVVFCSRERESGARVVDEILAITEQVAEDGITASPIFERTVLGLEWTGEFPRSRERFERVGIDLGDLLANREAHQ
ncbi:MAG: pilus assembly protein CpaF [Acidobacteria bacterium]|nr:MAG: pilus assembly protein CpaF [Acidobacteriota bacterium]